MLAVALASLPIVLLLSSSAHSGTVLQGPIPKEDVLRTQPRIRVLLADHTRGGVSLPVRVVGPYTLMDGVTRQILVQGAWLQSAFGTGPIQGLSEGVVVNLPDKAGRKRTVHVPRVRIMPSKPGTLQVGTRTYRGVLDIIHNHDGTMTLVNEINLEDYISGVVTAEMYFDWPAEALRAQAVVARSYTLALFMENEKMNPRPEWDVESGYLTNQEYQGVSGEHPRGIDATQATEGQILVWNGTVFRTYFHSCCGGHTEACGNVWDDYKTIPPLAGTACEYCKYSKHWDWTETLKLTDVEAALRKADKDVGSVRDMVFKDRNGDGHYDLVTVVGTKQTIEMKGNEFRLAVGPTILKSMRFTAKRAGDAFELQGRGWGHGVGLCQYGAQGMANLLMTCDRILKHYYPETELWKVY
jgi:stage II sporulation protein D